MSDRTQALLLTFFITCFFAGVIYLAYGRSLCETLEAESAIIARNFVDGKAFLINYLNGQEDLDKPPLYYWLIAGSSYIAPNWELAARIPSIGAVALLLILFWQICQCLKKDLSFLGLWILVFLMCPKVAWMSQVARMDFLFSATLFLSLFLFVKSVRLCDVCSSSKEESAFNKGYISGFFVTTGLSVMIKGPLGAILIFLTVILYLILSKKYTLIYKIFFSPYILLFFLTSIPWYIYAIIHTDFRFFHRFILEENLSRFTNLIPGGSFKDFNHSPPTRYIVYFLTGFFPWSLLAPIWLIKILRSWKKQEEVTRLFFVNFIFIFFFFSLALSKRSDYILPLYPVSAFLTADFLLRNRDAKILEISIKSILWGLGLVFSVMFLFAFFIYLESPAEFLTSFLSILNIKVNEQLLFYLEVLEKSAPAFLLVALASFAALVIFKKVSMVPLPGYLMGPSAILFLAAFLWVLPNLYAGKDARPFCRYVKSVVGRAPLYYPGFWDEECAFYLNRVIPRLSLKRAALLIKNGDKRFFFILDRKRYKYLKEMGVSFPFISKQGSPILRPLFLVSNFPDAPMAK